MHKGKRKITCNKCHFLVNTPESSHMGGTVERHIRTVRSILNNILYTNGYRLDTSSLSTYLYEVMALINSRSLIGTYIHDTLSDLLTPNHLTTMKTISTPPPPGKFDPEYVYSIKRWRRVQHICFGTGGRNNAWLTYRKAIYGRSHNDILLWVTLY